MRAQPAVSHYNNTKYDAILYYYNILSLYYDDGECRFHWPRDRRRLAQATQCTYIGSLLFYFSRRRCCIRDDLHDVDCSYLSNIIIKFFFRCLYRLAPFTRLLLLLLLLSSKTSSSLTGGNRADYYRNDVENSVGRFVTTIITRLSNDDDDVDDDDDDDDDRVTCRIAIERWPYIYNVL